MKKGFTLIELLGVIVILGVLALIAFPVVSSMLDKGMDDSSKIQEESFVNAAKEWASNNVFSLPAAGANKDICLNVLVDEGYLEANKNASGYYINMASSDKEYNLTTSCVKITNSGTASKAKYNYTFNPKYK